MRTPSTWHATMSGVAEPAERPDGGGPRGGADRGEPAEPVTDEQRLAEHGRQLAEAVDATLPGWVVRCVEDRVRAYLGDVSESVHAEAAAAGEQARHAVTPPLRALFDTDVDEQWTGPLAIIRRAVPYPTAVLQRAGIAAVDRDEAAEALFPDDVYDLTPASFADIDPSIQELGIAWGAAKAHVVLARRRAEGKR